MGTEQKNDHPQHRSRWLAAAGGVATVILACLGFPFLLGKSGDDSMTTSTRITIVESARALQFFVEDHEGTYPHGGQEVWRMLTNQTELEGTTYPPYLEEIPTDAWGRDLFYQYPPIHNAQKPDIWSYGLDPSDPGDDIGNW